MLENILNLKGVSVLTKEQQGNINGGQWCTLTTFLNGVRSVGRFPNFAEGSAGSVEANRACVNTIEAGTADSCFYDCEWDDDAVFT